MTEKRTFVVSGMHCAGCAVALEKAVKALPSVENVYVNFASGRLNFSSPTGTPSDEEVLAIIRKIGFKGSLPPAALSAEKEPGWWNDFSGFFIALIFTLLLLIVCFCKIPVDPRLNRGGQMVLLIPVLIAGRGFFIRGIPALCRLSPNMDSLISCGALAGIIYSIVLVIKSPEAHLYFDAAAMIVTLIMLGKALESRSRRSASSAVRQLLALTPPVAHLVRNGSETDVPSCELLPGDLVRVKPGEKIPADAVIKEGDSFVNESMLTGEELPVSKQAGDKLCGGTLNVDGTMLLEVTSTGQASVLGQIISLINEAQNSRPPAAKLADKVSGIFVWVIFASALMTALCWGIWGNDADALHFSLSVLVGACPCALGLAVPIALICGIGRGASAGILIKNGAALENAAGLKQLVFDKTGTLTAGIPEIRRIMTVKGRDKGEFLRSAAAVEHFSEHPLAQAVLNEFMSAAENVFLPVTDFCAVPGRGVRGNISGEKWIFGNRKMMEENSVELSDFPEVTPGVTVIYGAVDGMPAGVIEIGDQLRDEAVTALEGLRKLGIRVFMLTGDNQAAAEAIANKVQLDGVRAGLLPQDKVEALKDIRSRGGLTGMVGDGINDAPVLSVSDLGIAIGSGSDIAMESADVVLLRSDLLEVVKLLKLSKMTFRVIRQNLFWAFFYNMCGIPLAAGVFYILSGIRFNPAFCAGAMAASSLTVVLNALRLRRYKLD